MKRRFLFYFVHPAKFHLFRSTINNLKNKGYDVDIIITGRDILEEYYIGQQYSLIEEYFIILALVIIIDLIKRKYKWIIYGFTRA